ncbi:MAG: DHH family phosphoesterase [Acidimicrobiia bacterium]
MRLSMTPERRGTVDAVAEALDAAQSIGVVGHVGPDGDALGSMIALSLAARSAGKDAVASFAEPFVVPDEMSFLDTSTLVRPADFPTDLDAAVAVDTSVPERVGSLAGAMGKAKELIVIDHHLSDGSWGDTLLIDRTSAATTELVYEVIKALGWEISAAVADALYTGIVTDTGRFQYSNTSPRTHEITADLLDHGVATDVIGQKLFEETPFGYFEVVSRVLGRATLVEDKEFVWSYVTDTEVEEAGLRFHDIDGLIDLVRLPREAHVACLLKVKKQGIVKGSLRSRGQVDVAALAGAFGGGGHHNAAGFTASGSVDDVVERLVSQLS